MQCQLVSPVQLLTHLAEPWWNNDVQKHWYIILTVTFKYIQTSSHGKMVTLHCQDSLWCMRWPHCNSSCSIAPPPRNQCLRICPPQTISSLKFIETCKSPSLLIDSINSKYIYIVSKCSASFACSDLRISQRLCRISNEQELILNLVHKESFRCASCARPSHQKAPHLPNQTLCSLNHWLIWYICIRIYILSDGVNMPVVIKNRIWVNYHISPNSEFLKQRNFQGIAPWNNGRPLFEAMLPPTLPLNSWQSWVRLYGRDNNWVSSHQMIFKKKVWLIKIGTCNHLGWNFTGCTR